MGLKYLGKGILSGNFREGFNNLFIPDENIDTTEEVKQHQLKLLAEKREQGKLDEQEFQEMMELAQFTGFTTDEDNPGNVWQDPDVKKHGDVTDAFGEGLKEGADNIRKAIGNTLNKGAGLGLRMIPWQVWAILGVVVIIYLWPILAPRLMARKA